MEIRNGREESGISSQEQTTNKMNNTKPSQEEPFRNRQEPTKAFRIYRKRIFWQTSRGNRVQLGLRGGAMAPSLLLLLVFPTVVCAWNCAVHPVHPGVVDHAQARGKRRRPGDLPVVQLTCNYYIVACNVSWPCSLVPLCTNQRNDSFTTWCCESLIGWPMLPSPILSQVHNYARNADWRPQLRSLCVNQNVSSHARSTQEDVTICP